MVPVVMTIHFAYLMMDENDTLQTITIKVNLIYGFSFNLSWTIDDKIISGSFNYLKSILTITFQPQTFTLPIITCISNPNLLVQNSNDLDTYSQIIYIMKLLEKNKHQEQGCKVVYYFH